MQRKLLPLILLIASLLACALPGGPTPPPIDVVQTSVAATLTAAVPPTVPVPTVTPAPTLALTPTLAPPSAVCFVAVADFNTILCVNGPDQFEIANTSAIGTVSDVAISPDGGMVAYTVALIDGTAELWVVNSDGTNARKLVGMESLPATEPDSVSWPRTFQWQAGTHILFFDTGWTPAGGPFGPGEYINSDLWWVNADTGELTPMLSAGTAGYFSLSPDGNWIAVSQPESVSLISTDGATVLSDVITFPPIITYSEYAYKPEVTWSLDSSFFMVNIPSADPLAPDAGATIYRVGLDGTATQLVTLTGQFLFDHSLKISPDGGWVAYTKTVVNGANNEIYLNVARTDGTAESGGLVGVNLGVNLLGWSPDSARIAYNIAEDALYLANTIAVVGEIHVVQAVKEFAWTSPTAAVFSGSLNGHWGLRQFTLGSGFADLAGPFSNTMAFDVRR